MLQNRCGHTCFLQILKGTKFEQHLPPSRVVEMSPSPASEALVADEQMSPPAPRAALFSSPPSVNGSAYSSAPHISPLQATDSNFGQQTASPSMSVPSQFPTVSPFPLQFPHGNFAPLTMSQAVFTPNGVFIPYSAAPMSSPHGPIPAAVQGVSSQPMSPPPTGTVLRSQPSRDSTTPDAMAQLMHRMSPSKPSTTPSKSGKRRVTPQRVSSSDSAKSTWGANPLEEVANKWQAFAAEDEDSFQVTTRGDHTRSAKTGEESLSDEDSVRRSRRSKRLKTRHRSSRSDKKEKRSKAERKNKHSSSDRKPRDDPSPPRTRRSSSRRRSPSPVEQDTDMEADSGEQSDSPRPRRPTRRSAAIAAAAMQAYRVLGGEANLETQKAYFSDAAGFHPPSGNGPVAKPRGTTKPEKRSSKAGGAGDQSSKRQRVAEKPKSKVANEKPKPVAEKGKGRTKKPEAKPSKKPTTEAKEAKTKKDQASKKQKQKQSSSAAVQAKTPKSTDRRAGSLGSLGSGPRGSLGTLGSLISPSGVTRVTASSPPQPASPSMADAVDASRKGTKGKTKAATKGGTKKRAVAATSASKKPSKAHEAPAIQGDDKAKAAPASGKPSSAPSRSKAKPKASSSRGKRSNAAEEPQCEVAPAVTATRISSSPGVRRSSRVRLVVLNHCPSAITIAFHALIRFANPRLQQPPAAMNLKRSCRSQSVVVAPRMKRRWKCWRALMRMAGCLRKWPC